MAGFDWSLQYGCNPCEYQLVYLELDSGLDPQSVSGMPDVGSKPWAKDGFLTNVLHVLRWSVPFVSGISPSFWNNETKSVQQNMNTVCSGS
jgi:hypothetical protein